MNKWRYSKALKRYARDGNQRFDKICADAHETLSQLQHTMILEKEIQNLFATVYDDVVILEKVELYDDSKSGRYIERNKKR